MVKVYLGLGSNLGDRTDNLRRAIDLLAERCGPVPQRSAIYATEPVDYTPQPEFLNQVVLLETAKVPGELLRECLQIEAELGRVRAVPKGPRVIDIDILLYGDQVINDPGPPPLIVPHPHLHSRAFVLVPLQEIAGDLIHPVLQQSIAALRQKLCDLPRVDRVG